MGEIQLGLQMYTLREEAEKDFKGTLKKVAQLGYQGVEFAGYGDMSSKELKKLLDTIGLKAASSHIPIEILEKDLEEIIEYQLLIGSKHIVCPYLLPERRTEKGYYELINSLNDIGRSCYEKGVTFSYHNHDFELLKLGNGRKPLDILLEETNPEWVKAEFDIYWLTKAGEKPIEWMDRYKGRTPLIHLKDMTTNSEQFFAELGTGGVDVEGVIKQGTNTNIEWFIVEQDASRRTPFESIEISLHYLKNIIG